ncbi:MAG: helix-turn-helix domain-containing protein [Streptomycetaceae bacterium]|nr:helix-turn-helix domain-containing protein [Streptomycetaceae bacterium]NUS54757.1 helix-turn-helix domain-containing protein [Streptomycetaceae bacterium]
MDEQQRAAFGAQVRRARKARGMSQQDLANEAGLDAKTLSNIEQGRNVRPGILNAVRDTLGLAMPAAEATPDADVALALDMVRRWLEAADGDAERKDRMFQLTRVMVADNLRAHRPQPMSAPTRSLRAVADETNLDQEAEAQEEGP